MESPLSTLIAIAPEVGEIVNRRFSVLEAVSNGAPVGRRTLANKLGWSERVTRAEIELLRELNLIDVFDAGVSLSESGRRVLLHIADVLHEMLGLDRLQQRLAQEFGLDRVVIVPGDSETQLGSRIALARRTAQQLLAELRPDSTVAVSGGSTLADVAGQVHSAQSWPGVTVVPTGGGLGDTLRIEANTIAAEIASTLGAKYRLLHVPDDLNEQSVNALLKANKTVADIFSLIHSATLVLQGIGSMRSVAQRRGFSDDQIQQLELNGAVGESLGHFFSDRGEVVGTSSAVGLQVDDLAHVQRVIAVAGGVSKAHAISALLRTGLQHVLVTDQAAAEEIVRTL